MTGNHGYETPAAGTTNWDEPLNRNFVRLETDVEVRDTDASRSNYTPHDGAKFLATDTGSVYVGDGSSWQHLGDVVVLGGDLYVRSDPPNAVTNDLWVDTSNDVLNVHSGDSWATVETADATSTGIVEDGEGDLSAYSGETGYFSITSDAISGSGSVLGSGAGHATYRTIASMSGLGTYPEPGDTIRWLTEVRTKNTDTGALFGVQSGSDPWHGYRLALDTGASPGVMLERVNSDGTNDDLSIIDTSIDVGTTYEVEVQWGTDGSMPYTVSEHSTGTIIAEDTAPTVDTTYKGGGIGFMVSATWTGQDTVEGAYDEFEVL